jgi:O-antigen/teichoic acid export membrane protein
MIGLMVISLDSTLGYSLVAVGDTTKPVMINAVRTIVSVSSYLLLIPRYGMVGAAIANALAIALVNPAYVYFLRKKGIDVDIFAFVKPFLIFAAFAILVVMIPWSAMHRIGLIACYLFVNVMLGIIKKDELLQLWLFIAPFYAKFFGLCRGSRQTTG